MPLPPYVLVKDGCDGGYGVVANDMIRWDLGERRGDTAMPEDRVEVSRRIKGKFENGHESYSAHGKAISLPDARERRPTAAFLAGIIRTEITSGTSAMASRTFLATPGPLARRVESYTSPQFTADIITGVCLLRPGGSIPRLCPRRGRT